MNRWKFSFGIAAAIVARALGALRWWGSRIRQDIRDTRAAMEQTPHPCPPGAEVRVGRWGEVGYSRACMVAGKYEGSWVAWSRQRLAIAGEYRAGVKHGTWTWWAADGSRYRVMQFERGAATSDELMSRRAPQDSGSVGTKDAL